MGTGRIVAASVILVTGLLQAGGADAHQQTVQVFRGSHQASIVEIRESQVQVFRGTPMARPVASAKSEPAPQSDVQVVSSGSNVWFVDRAADSLSVCRLVKTTQVGEYRIACRSRTLPY